MMKRTVHVLLDDLDGRETGPGGETISFAIDGVAYEIDLNSRNAAKLREAVGPFASAGTRIGRGGTVVTRTGPVASGADLRARKEYRARVAAWVQETKGITPPDRGRLKESWYTEYEEAQREAARRAITGPPAPRKPVKTVPAPAFTAPEPPQTPTRRRRAAASA